MDLSEQLRQISNKMEASAKHWNSWKGNWETAGWKVKNIPYQMLQQKLSWKFHTLELHYINYDYLLNQQANHLQSLVFVSLRV